MVSEAGQYQLTGAVGILLYLLVLALSIHSLRLYGSQRSKSTRRFFASIALMSLFELPRFFSLAIDKEYTSRNTYCAHIIAGGFFFLSFSIVARQWSSLLSLGHLSRAHHVRWSSRIQHACSRLIFGVKALVLCNILFALIDIVNISLCASSRSLQGFFFSTPFEVITLCEATRNAIYALFLLFFGMKLVNRFRHFASIERHQQSLLGSTAAVDRRSVSGSTSSLLISQQSKHSLRPASSHASPMIEFSTIEAGTSSGLEEGSRVSVLHSSSMPPVTGGVWTRVKNRLGEVCGCPSLASEPSYHQLQQQQQQQQQHPQVFSAVVRRFALVLLVVSICFVFRVCMLIVKTIVLHSAHASPHVGSHHLTLFGFWWFLFSDFIPRVGPSLVLIFLMQTRRPSKESLSSQDHARHRYAASLQEENVALSGNQQSSGAGRDGDEVLTITFKPIPEDESLHSDLNQHLLSAKDLCFSPSTSSRDRGFSADQLGNMIEDGDSLQHVSFAAMHESFLENLSDYSDDDEDDDDGLNVNFGEAAIDRLFSLISTPQD